MYYRALLVTRLTQGYALATPTVERLGNLLALLHSTGERKIREDWRLNINKRLLKIVLQTKGSYYT